MSTLATGKMVLSVASGVMIRPWFNLVANSTSLLQSSRRHPSSLPKLELSVLGCLDADRSDQTLVGKTNLSGKEEMGENA